MTTTTTRPSATRPSRSRQAPDPGKAKPAARARPAPGAPTRRSARNPAVSSTRARAARTTAARTPVPAQPRAPFVLLIVGLLGGALVSLLLLNTVLAEDAFTLTRLQRSNKQLDQQRQALQEQIAREEAPAMLAQKAKALGMIQPTRPAFFDAQTGRVVGPRMRPVPHAAAASAGAVSVIAVPGAVVPGDGIITGWGAPAAPVAPEGGRR